MAEHLLQKSQNQPCDTRQWVRGPVWVKQKRTAGMFMTSCQGQKGPRRTQHRWACDLIHLKERKGEKRLENSVPNTRTSPRPISATFNPGTCYPLHLVSFLIDTIALFFLEWLSRGGASMPELAGGKSRQSPASLWSSHPEPPRPQALLLQDATKRASQHELIPVSTAQGAEVKLKFFLN